MRTAAIAAVSAMLAGFAAYRLFLRFIVRRPAAMTIARYIFFLPVILMWAAALTNSRRMFSLHVILRWPAQPALEGWTAAVFLLRQAEHGSW